MLLSADLHPFSAPLAACQCVCLWTRRYGRAALIFVNFACNSCLIADRTIAIRRRCAAVMRTKSGRVRAGRHGDPPNSGRRLRSLFPTVRRVPEKALVSSCESAVWVGCGFPGGAIDDVMTPGCEGDTCGSERMARSETLW